MFVDKNLKLMMICLVVSLVGGNAVPGYAGESERRRFQAEYPGANRRLEALLTMVKGTGKLESTAKDRTIVYRVDFAVDGPSRKVVRDALTQFVTSPSGSSVESKRESQSVYCVTPDVAFSLFRKMEDQPYSLSEFEDNGPADSVSIFLDRYLMAPYGVFGIPMSEIMADPSFKVRSVDAISEGGGLYLKVSFDYAPKTIGLRSGWIMVSPQDRWAIVRAECQMGDKPENRLICKVEYGERAGEVRFPKRVSYTLPGSRHSVFEFAEIVTERSAAKDFTLAAFGLPDLGRPGVSRATSSGRYWLFLLAFVALVIAITMRYGASRVRRA